MTIKGISSGEPPRTVIAQADKTMQLLKLKGVPSDKLYRQHLRAIV